MIFVGCLTLKFGSGKSWLLCAFVSIVVRSDAWRHGLFSCLRAT